MKLNYFFSIIQVGNALFMKVTRKPTSTHKLLQGGGGSESVLHAHKYASGDQRGQCTSSFITL